MPATSKAQRRLMGAALRCKKTGECASDKIKDIADSMTIKQLKDYTKTKEKNLPEKFKESRVKNFIEFFQSL